MRVNSAAVMVIVTVTVDVDAAALLSGRV